jgi:hypothetical protein
MPQAKPATPSWAKRPEGKREGSSGDTSAALEKYISGDKKKGGARLNADIDPELRAKFKAKCALKKLEMQSVLTELIEGWVNT